MIQDIDGLPFRGYVSLMNSKTPLSTLLGFLIVFTSLFLSCLPVYCLAPKGTLPQIVNASIRDSKKTVSLMFNTKMTRFLEKIKEWECILKQKGYKTEFFLGAGEVRRAVLNMDIDGPGDIEVFIHFYDKEFKTFNIGTVLIFLKEQGIDLKGTIQEIFGSEKKLDLFAKDKISLEKNRPYRGEFSFFENMGDTSLNALLYSVSTGMLTGDSECLSTLAKKRIAFTEPVKAARLSEPKKIPKIKGKTSRYNKTILRMALRCIRLKMDLAVASNPNGLKMDGSFKEVLHGFELYFKSCTSEEIALFPLDYTYLEQFWKIFRNRKPEELEKIHDIFMNELPETVRIMKALGLEVDRLTDPESGKPSKILEFEAVQKNAGLKMVEKFYDASQGRITNPFLSEEKLLSFVKSISLRGVKPENMKPVPLPVLFIYSPSLHYAVTHFGELNFYEQNQALAGYEKAVKFFSQKAMTRISKNKSFLAQYYGKFYFLDLSHLDPKDERTLLAFIEDEWALALKTGGVTPQYSNHEGLSLEKVTQSIKDSLKWGKTPVIFVDLDDTAFIYASRIRNILKAFDLIYGTEYFKNLELSEIPLNDYKEFLYGYFQKKHPDVQKLNQLIENINSFLNAERNDPEFIARDEVNPLICENLKNWIRIGAKIIYLSARFENSRLASIESLTKNQLWTGELILYSFKGPSLSGEEAEPGLEETGDEEGEEEGNVSVPDFKSQEIAAYAAKHPEFSVIAFLDDSSKNTLTVKKFCKGIQVYRVLMAYSGSTLQTLILDPDQPITPRILVPKSFPDPDESLTAA